MGRATIYNQVSRRTDKVARIGALTYACIWVAVGLLAALNVIDQSSKFVGLPTVCMLGAVWLAYAGYAYYAAGSNAMLMRSLLVYNAMSLVYTAFVIDATSPLVFTWSLVIAASGVYLNLAGSIVSSLVLMLGLAIGTNIGEIFDSFYLFAITVLVGIITSSVIKQAQRDQQELDESHLQAELQRDRTTTLINNLTDAVISTDLNGTITLYNAAALNLLDTNMDLDDKNIDEVMQLRTEDGKTFSLADELSKTNIAETRDDLFTLISGETTRLEISYSPIRSSFHDSQSSEENEVGGYIIIVRDITKAKSLEEERDEFISVVSHELRTPITIAEGTISNAQIMMQRKDVPEDKVTAAIDTAHDQIVFLARMVNDLSTLSRAERGVADETEEIDVNELIKGIYDEHQSEAAEKGLSFDLHIPTKVGSVVASKLYLKELLQNFVTNAIKYTQSGTVTIDVKKLPYGKVEFAVSDTGIGISKADQKKIFEKFYRAEDYRTRESNGTGLGLYVSAKLAKKLDTTITVKSRLNHGSRFSIALPLADKPKTKK